MLQLRDVVMIKQSIVAGAILFFLGSQAALSQEDRWSKARDCLLQGKYAELEIIAKDMLKENPSDPFAMEFLAESYFGQGQITAALAMYEEEERATNILMKRLEARLSRCREYVNAKLLNDALDLLKQNKPNEALKLANQALATKNSAYAHLIASKIYREMGDKKNADSEAQKAIELDARLRLDLDPQAQQKRYLDTLREFNETKEKNTIPKDFVQLKHE